MRAQTRAPPTRGGAEGRAGPLPGSPGAGDGDAELVLRDEQGSEGPAERTCWQSGVCARAGRAHLLTSRGPSLVLQRRAGRHAKGGDRSRAPSRSVGADAAASPPGDSGNLPEERLVAPSRERWAGERRPVPHGGGDSALRELDDGQFDPEDAVTQVTCM